MIGQKYVGLDGQVHYYLPNPNNVKDFYQTAHILTNNISVEGGTAEHSFRVSFTNTQSNDIVQKMNEVAKNNVNARFFNTLYKKKDNTFMKEIWLDTKLSYYDDLTKNRQYLNGDSKNPIFTYINMSRNTDLNELSNYKYNITQEMLKDPYWQSIYESNPNVNGTEVGSDNFSNPYWLINENTNEDHKMRIVANFDMHFQLLEELGLNLRYGKDYSYLKGFEFRNTGANRDDKDGFYKDFHNYYDNQLMEFLFTFDKTWLDTYSLTANFGGNRTENKGYNTWQQIQSLKVADFMHISNSNEKPEVDKGSGKKRINSLLGSVTLGYKSWAFLDLTARNDWSSSLPVENCSYFYPSVGGSWIISDMLNIPSSVFFGKIRGSWAQTGSDTDPYNLLLYYPLEGTNIYNGEKFISIPDSKPKTDNETLEPNLMPERTKAYEIGADVRFFNGRLNIDFTYYSKITSDQIVRAATSVASGFAYSVKNAGSIENKGVELSVTAIPVKLKNGFEWEINGNFTKNNSMVLSMPEGLDKIELSRCWNSAVYIEEGMPYGVVRASAWARDENGRRLVKDDGSPVIMQNVYLGDANPDFLLGISNRFRYPIPKGYGNVDLYCLIDIKKGGGIFSGSRKQGIRSGVFFPEYTSGDALQERIDYWERSTIFGESGEQLQGGSRFDNIYYVKTDEKGKYVIKKDANGNNVSDANGNDVYESGEKCEQYFLPLNVGYYSDDIDELVYYDASYVKLRELSVGYNFPQKWISKVFLSSARISAVGRNLWIIYQKTPKGLDPEAASYSGNGQGLETGGLPPTTTFGFDVKLTF
jgi:outer membrane receptor protein involved in Fe transport